MYRINCTVDNCSHNKSNVCYADRINIAGSGSETSSNTCCASFLDHKSYGSLVSNFTSEAQCEALVCGVNTCKYNENHLCSLPSITVEGNFVNLYSETSCGSFYPKE